MEVRFARLEREILDKSATRYGVTDQGELVGGLN
jgi:hypothetical protein